MTKLKSFFNYFTKGELILWFSSIVIVIASFILSHKSDYLNLVASLIGVTSIMFNAKGNPIGQLLMIIFSALYGIISFSFAYYGEMITYLCMTAPMAIFALVSWLKNPYDGNKSEVKVNKISKKEYFFMLGLALIVTVAFYFILSAFNTANIIPSTLSVTTSFTASYLTFRRSPYYAVWYALNDIVLIVMWVLAAFEDSEYVSVIVCFAAFLANDIYCFINWRRMEKRQAKFN